MTTSDLPLLLGLGDVAQAIGLGRGTLRKWAAGVRPAPAGFPPILHVGGRRAVRRIDLEKWVAGLGAPESTESTPSGAPTATEGKKRARGRPRKVMPKP